MGVFSSASIEELIDIGPAAARYLGNGIRSSPMILFGAAYELGAATPTGEKTAAFLATLLDFLPRYPKPIRSINLPSSLVHEPLRLMNFNLSDAEWNVHIASVDALFISELLNDIDCAISGIVSAHPVRSALAPLWRRVDEQLCDPGAWFSAEFLAIRSTLDAIESIDPDETRLTKFDLDSELDCLRTSSCKPHLVPDNAGTIFLAGRGQHRFARGVPDYQSFDQYVSMRLRVPGNVN